MAQAIPLAASLREAFFVVMHDHLDELDLDGLEALVLRFQDVKKLLLRSVVGYVFLYA